MIVALLLLWQLVCSLGLVPKFMLPSPVDVVKAFVGDFPLLLSHMGTTLTEAFWGLMIAISLAFLVSLGMENSRFLHQSIYPLLVLTQTIPTVAIAPLLVLWMGYDMAPKITLIVITCFFPVTVSLLNGYAAADPDAIRLMRAMGGSGRQIFRYIKFPSALPSFFAGLRVAASYSVVGAVISEWLGGFNGLGVYMTRVKKSYAFDKMFAVILLISIVSLLLMRGVSLLEKKVMPWERIRAEDAS